MANFLLSQLFLYISFVLLHVSSAFHLSSVLASFMARISSPFTLFQTLFSWMDLLLRSFARWTVDEADLVISSVRAEILGPDHPIVLAFPYAPSTDDTVMVYAIANASLSLFCTFVLLVLVMPLIRAFFLISEIASRARKLGDFFTFPLHNRVIDPNEEQIPQEELIITLEETLVTQETSTHQVTGLAAVVTDQHSSTELVEESQAPDADVAATQEATTPSSHPVRLKRKSTKRAAHPEAAKPEAKPNSSDEPAYWGKPGGFRYVQLPAKKNLRFRQNMHIT